MVNLFRAEWTKIAGHRWVTGCLIWVFPIGAVAFMVVVGIALVLSSSARTSFAADETLWTDQAIGTWDFLSNPVGRLLLIGFTAVMFAGEYQWQTWKNIIPRNRRVTLILNKFFTLGVFVVVAFALMSILVAVGMGVLRAAVGASYPPELSGEVLRDFAGDYALQAGLGFTSTIIAAGYAALAAMLTRSILGGVLVAFAVTFAESASALGLILIAYFLNVPDIVELYRFTPGYNLLNVTSWVRNSEAAVNDLSFNDHTIMLSDSLTFSIAVVVVWVVALVGLTTYLFQRQDISS